MPAGRIWRPGFVAKDSMDLDSLHVIIHSQDSWRTSTRR